MTRTQILETLMLLSAMESWSFSLSKPVPDYLHERLALIVDALSADLLKGEQ